jgi:hypothetical protein
MISLLRGNTMLLWAARETGRHPVQAVLLFLAIAALTALVAVVLLTAQALTNTCDHLMDQTPMVVVRRVCGGGLAPMPVHEALTCAQGVAGVLRPRVRLWGVVDSVQGAVTITAGVLDAEHLPARAPILKPGQAWIGPGVFGEPGFTDLVLRGAQTLTLTVTYHLPVNSGMATHDVVVVHGDDARRLLGLEQDQASDLAIDVYHEDEIPALTADLAAAFPWPVRVSTRQAQKRQLKAKIAQRCGTSLLAVIPLALAAVCLFAAQGVWCHRQRYQWGLLKALGWTSRDIVRLHMLRAFLVGAPALMCGLAIAYGLMFWPDSTWIPRMLFGWPWPAQGLRLTAQGAGGAMLLSLCLVGLPLAAAGFWWGWQGIKAQPADLLTSS